MMMMMMRRMISRALLGPMAALGFRLSLLLLLSAVGYAGAAGACSSVAFSSNRVYAACSDLPRLSSSLHWSYDNASATLSLAFVAPPAKPEGWVAWAINPTGDGMIGSQALIAFHQPDGEMGVQTYNITGLGPIAKGPIDFKTWDLAAEYSGGVTRLYGKMKLAAGTTVVNQVWQVGSAVANGVPQKHDFLQDNLQSKGTVDLVKGAVSLSGGSTTRKRNVHGVLNAVSWGILLPIGAIFARYLKTFKSADPAWFYLHVTCQIIGYGVGVGGWATGLNLGSKSKGIQYTTHRNIGIALFSLATLQVFALFMRPSKDNKYRFYWNIYHYLVGYTVIVLGIVNVFKGLKILSTDHKWTVGYIIAICILGGIALFLEVVTWLIVLKRKSKNPTKPSDGSNSNGVQRPLSV
ncbi:cytochrome b561 and DOMON domain-containing protein At4g12980 [Musa acuminata AAA Group]|uniref:cytochrome b561 and DOMON domain-containing protein At4g12980 n=1 Tax=Musa acuminata AAA Group TaxID=214697 RepID=UPI0031D97138